MYLNIVFSIALFLKTKIQFRVFSCCPLGASDMWNQTHDKHPADDDVPEPEEWLLPASTGQQGPPHTWSGPSDPAGGGDSASGEEEACSWASSQARAQRQGPLFCGHERTGDKCIKAAARPVETGPRTTADLRDDVLKSQEYLFMFTWSSPPKKETSLEWTYTKKNDFFFIHDNPHLIVHVFV